MIPDFAAVEFAWPWAAAALLLPLLVRWLLPALPNQADAALKTPHDDYFGALGAADSAGRGPRWRLALAMLAWLALTAAAARPQLLGEELSAPVTGRNLMLAIDLSGSMEVRDFSLAGQNVNRLIATKAVAGEFIDRREGDRIGLILFGEHAYLQAPLTFDRTTVKTLLLESAIGLAGEKTAIGDAIGLAVRRIRDAGADASEQVLILLTDGANTAGSIPPVKAAELAAAEGLKIYTIGIGADRMTIQSGFSGRLQQVNPSTALDERTLTTIAELTGGQYFRARDTRSLTRIYARLDELEPAADDEEGLRPVEDVFYWPLALAIVLAALAAVPVPGFAPAASGVRDAG
ncbi:MAG: VWA domain-containing protein [Pseudomonadota bacterium]